MAKIEELAIAVLEYDSLLARTLVQVYYDLKLALTHIEKPVTEDSDILVTSAALIEMLSMRRGQNPPDWTKDVGPLVHSRFLLKAATSMQRLRRLCETEAPEPLRKRGLFAPPNFLEFV